MSEKVVEAEDEVRTFCATVGELILWGSAIDAQLTKAVISLCSLAPSPMLEPIVAELGFQAKLQILRANTKHIENPDWATEIKKWLAHSEAVNGFRNIVAHHQVALEDGQLTLYSLQARKILKRINEQTLQPAKTIDDIKEWVEAAKKAFEEGQNVLANLDRLVLEMAKRKAEPRPGSSAAAQSSGALRILPRF